jgi:hypothetical protein
VEWQEIGTLGAICYQIATKTMWVQAAELWGAQPVFVSPSGSDRRALVTATSRLSRLYAQHIRVEETTVLPPAAQYETETRTGGPGLDEGLGLNSSVQICSGKSRLRESLRGWWTVRESWSFQATRHDCVVS